MSAYRIFVACVLALMLGACDSNYLVERYKWRWGPDPSIPRSDVDTVIAGQIMVLDYITSNALGRRYIDMPAVSTNDWFEVAKWGFNVGRQDCQVYLNYMFRTNREKQRDDGIIAGVSAASSAIVAVTTRNPAKALSVLAASFGLATALNDAIFQSYLFSEAPGLIAIKVKDLQDVYQQQVEKNQFAQQKSGKLVAAISVKTKTTTNANSPANTTQVTDTTTAVVKPITTAQEAYSAIQNYYNICLPQSIEGVLLQAVADSSAKTSSPANASSPKLVSTAK